MKTVGVVILNWNLAKDTVVAIESLKKHIKSCKLKIIVIDNGSILSDVSLLSKIRSIKLIKNKINLGYAVANNQGIKSFLSANNVPEYILLFNNDAYCVNDFLLPLLDEIERDSEIASTSPLIYYADQKTKLWSSGGVIDLEKGLMSSDYYHHLKNWANKHEPYIVDWNTGCVNLIRSDLLSKCGLLSEELEMYVEDVELSLRFKTFDCKCLVVPASIAYHSVSKSSGGSGSTTSRYYISRNTVLVANAYIKHNKLFILKNCINQIYQSINGRNTLLLLVATARGLLEGIKLSTKGRSLIRRF